MSNEAITAAAAILKRDEHVNLTIGGMPIEVVTLEGHEKLNLLFRFDLVCEAPAEGPPPNALIGKETTIELHDSFGLTRTVTGICSDVCRLVRDDGRAQLDITVRPGVYPLSLGRDSRVFNDMTVPEIIARVLERTSAPKRFDLTRSYRKRVYTAQYREDDWVFISRLCEDDGIYYWFDHTDGSTLVFSDDSTASPAIVGGVIDFALERGMTQDKDTIFELASEAHATPTKFTVGSFDPQRPALKVVATEGDGVHEMYDAPGGGPVNPSDCQRRANDRLQAAKAARAGVSGNATSVRLVPGMAMTVLGHLALDHTYFITETTYRVEQRRRFSSDAAEAFLCHLEAIKQEVPFRPQEISPVSSQAGIQTGRVVGPPGEEIHTDERGCVRVQLHWDREGQWNDRAGKWMRVAQRATASSMLLPRVGWNVTAFMEEGNVDAPAILSRVHDADHPPTYPLPANKTRTVFRTETTPADGTANEIRFEDLAGVEEMFLNATRDMNFITKHAATEMVGHDQKRAIGNNQEVSVAKRFAHNVKNDQTWSVTGNQKLTVEQDRGKDVDGNETYKVTGNRKVEVGSNAQISVQKARKLEVGGNLVETTKSNITYSAGETLFDIGGSMVLNTKRMMSCEAGEGIEQTVKGAKIELIGEDRPYTVNNICLENIKGSLIMRAGERFMDGSKNLTSWTVKAAVKGTAPKIHIEAKDKIELKCGASTITVDKTSVTIRATTYDLSSSPQLISDTSIINHN